MGCGDSSIFTSLRHQFPEQSKAQALRKKQAAKMAYKHVAQGIQHFKSQKLIEAFQCLNQALVIDPEHVEALVARGALYANKGNLERAIEDFEKALEYDKHHKNGRKYMCETLLELGSQFEEDKNEDKACEMYERILKIDPGHEAAKEAHYNLRGLEQDAQELGVDIRSFKEDKEMLERFREFIKVEKAKKEKQKEKLFTSAKGFSFKVEISISPNYPSRSSGVPIQ